jgi:hypothetical protein
VHLIDEVEGFVQITMDWLKSSNSAEDNQAYSNIVPTTANFSLQIVIGISNVFTEHNNWNNPGEQLPPVLPLDLGALLSREFVSCLQEQRIRLRQKILEEEVEKIDEQFCKLRLAFEGTKWIFTNAAQCPSIFCCSIIWKVLGSTLKRVWTPADVLWGHRKRYAKYKSILHCKQHRKLRHLFEKTRWFIA